MLANLVLQDLTFGLTRWLHFFFGVMWIGYLYYFNFTHGSAMAQADAPVKSGITRKLLPIAMYWFRWGAMWTLVTGLIMLGLKGHQQGMQGAWGLAIGISGILGITMWANVWFVIWPHQKIIMASAEQVAGGGTANPAAAISGPKALLASRTNTLFSIPLLLFMGTAAHPFFAVSPESNVQGAAMVLLILWLLLEGNALKGKLGPMQTVKGVITCGFALSIAICGILAIFI